MGDKPVVTTPDPVAKPTEVNSPPEPQPVMDEPSDLATKLVGTWTGTFGRRPAQLVIESVEGPDFGGHILRVKDTGATTVEISGTVDSSSGSLHFSENSIVSIPSGDTWDLGSDTAVFDKNSDDIKGTSTDSIHKPFGFHFSRGGELPKTNPDLTHQEWSITRYGFTWTPISGVPRVSSIKGVINDYHTTRGDAEAYVQTQVASGSYDSYPEETDRLWSAKGYHHYTVIKLEKTDYAGEPALLWEFTLDDSHGISRRHRNYYFNHGGRGFAISTVSDQSDWEQNEAEFQRILDSFKFSP
jgi:hypothetical protein